MKNSLNLCIAILFLAVLGCSCPMLKELTGGGDTSTPRPINIAVNTVSTPSSTPRSDAPTTGTVTRAKFDQIDTGMKRADVEKIMGSKGEVYYSSTGGGVKYESVKWADAKYNTILVSYQNDKVTSKSQVGL